jgi:peroxiredoxin Q/BCP
MARGPQEGDPAPDFELEGTEGTFRLDEHRGERVVLLFYPGDETPVCTRQFCSYRDQGDELARLDATVVGISSQSVSSHARFSDRHDLTCRCWRTPIAGSPASTASRCRAWAPAAPWS